MVGTKIVKLCIPVEGDDSLATYARIHNAHVALAKSMATAVAEANLGALDGDDYGNGVYRLWFGTSDPARLSAFIQSMATELPPGWSVDVDD